MSEFKYVPVELTHDMEMAMIQAANRSADCSHKDLYAAAIEAAPTQTALRGDAVGWISTVERLPEIGQSVTYIVLMKDSDYHIMNGSVQEGDYTESGFSTNGLIFCHNVSKWMPRAEPSPAESDKEAVRNAALDEAAKIPREYAEQLDRSGWGNRFPDELTAIFNAAPNMAYQICRLKSQPAQPSIDCGVVCQAARDDGVTCPDDECDRDNGCRPAQPSDSQALFLGLAQDEEPRVKHTCNMGVGCEEAGICYADAHGEPGRCGKQSIDSQTKVPEDEDDLPIGYVDWYNRYFAIQDVDMHRFSDCEEAWREAYKAAMRADRDVPHYIEKKGD